MRHSSPGASRGAPIRPSPLLPPLHPPLHLPLHLPLLPMLLLLDTIRKAAAEVPRSESVAMGGSGWTGLDAAVSSNDSITARAVQSETALASSLATAAATAATAAAAAVAAAAAGRLWRRLLRDQRLLGVCEDSI